MAAEEAPQGIDVERVGEWLEQNVDGAERPFTYVGIAGGRSNLTYTVIGSGGRRWALRRPPMGTALGSAHDMGREVTGGSAMAATDVPVAPIAGYCTDDSVNGAPFYVMEFVDGPILRQRPDAEEFPEQADRRAIGERVVDTLVAIHAVDPDAVGLGELGRKEDYVKRQLRRWQGQWEGSKTREIPLVEEVGAKLASRIPDQGPAAIVHGDYRLDNMILTDSGEIAAVVDWELCTLGDPLADVGLLLVYWGEEGDSLLPLFEPATMAPGFPSRADVRARYAERSGRDLSEIDYYIALGYWKLAIILEGVYSRYAKGQYGKPEAGFEEFGKNVGRLAEAADEAVERLG
ncbi:MAG: phosphotransferase family protein [Solirubrobacterales bacterium]|nr:phosphotransferase family protein [Solirubrobacterales bacterium]